ncbi:hypothetical protein WUBG_06588 [Wuchereria bancrofti]|uniref:Uncharacterized protein n=1 Tax=Wuchereria bancrofti TaxID=6293 RepID=J9B632_WUCBA|nr:hypothetical protein WUBG_06588 [Wuchereria bancrofti]
MIAINRNPNKNKAGNLFRCVETDYYISQHRYYLLHVSEDDSDRCPDGRIEILKVNGKMEILKVQLYFKTVVTKTVRSTIQEGYFIEVIAVGHCVYTAQTVCRTSKCDKGTQLPEHSLTTRDGQ